MYRVIVLLCAIHVSHGFLCLPLQAQVAELQRQISELNALIYNEGVASSQQLTRLQQEVDARISNTQIQINKCIQENQLAASGPQPGQQIEQLQAKLAAQENASQAATQCQQQLSALQQEEKAVREHEQELKKQLERGQQKLLQQEERTERKNTTQHLLPSQSTVLYTYRNISVKNYQLL
ncbi:mediator of RNA polymerase II transcription subunit 15-like [Zerene cesonia]|uniref:mediator of RNA polymerase II transcription subunit 15-like n=1 Tax=Zerene cesonia TaxID=33412 RepID=UPI0018E54379|nr:mediator of RNA polymerase II transcription subunit 15-like [Zerene cesonia]